MKNRKTVLIGILSLVAVAASVIIIAIRSIPSVPAPAIAGEVPSDSLIFGYDENGNLNGWQGQGQDLGFEWQGTWPANDQVMDAVELQQEMGEEEFWEVFGDEKD